jgi:flagellar motor switch protein FliM
VTPAAASLVRFERLAPALAEPIVLVRFRMAPLRGCGLLAIPTSLLGVLVQTACGGASSPATPLAARELSPIEVRLIQRFAAGMLAELEVAWAPVAAVECAVVRVEANPLFARIAAPEELVVQADLAIAGAGLPPATVSLVVPNGSLDPVRGRLQATGALDDDDAPALDAAWAASLRERLLEVPVDVVVDLGAAALPMSRLLGLAVGDVIPLDTGREDPVPVRAGGATRFLAAPGIQNGSNAVRITERR